MGTASIKIPLSLYRLQISKSFTFDHAKEELDYLYDLGFDGLYCSPFYEACSEHGYDITDPNKVSEQVGDFDAFCKAVHERGMQIIIDVVPNHMGFRNGKNRWWQDLLANGKESPYAHFFDINWTPLNRRLENKVHLPILGINYAEALGEIQLENGQLSYRGFPLPLAKESKIPQKSDKQSIHTLLEQQHYRISHWRTASHEINYRRFFNIFDLVAICIEHQDVLEAHHKWLFELLERGQVDGIRIDHPDGLYDPAAYFKEIRRRYPVFTVVEKILGSDEELADWKVEGSVGYEYLNLLNGLYIESQHEGVFTKIYDQFTGEKNELIPIILDSKRRFARNYMASEVEQLACRLEQIAEERWETRDFTRFDLTDLLTEVIATFPIYRTYVVAGQKPSIRDEQAINQAIKIAKSFLPHLEPAIFNFLETILLTHPFAQRFQQLTGPIMAKGLEDTTFYRYNRFCSLNEVGGNPAHFGYSVSHFHEKNQRKREKWPYGLLTTSTHDTKRSEDARMRLNVISEIPKEWEEKVNHWRSLDSSIDANTTYYIYQTLLAGWPRGEPEWPEFFERMWMVVLKSIREAKEKTDWDYPDQEYESRVEAFLRRLLTPGSKFLQSFVPFVEKIEPFAEKSGLSALAIKVASPGVIDCYQGNETWVYRLVDPDNRTYFKRAESSSKLQFLKTVLNFRREHRELFLDGEYIPLKSAHNTIAFIRRTEKEELLVIAGRFFASNPDFGTLNYTGTLMNLFTQNEVQLDGENSVRELLKERPAAYLYRWLY